MRTWPNSSASTHRLSFSDANFHFRFRMIERWPATSPIVARVPSGRARSTTGMPARSMIA
jgi:hypothetical protein